ncbi:MULTISPECIES: adenylyltransferase/cytidyltransferase family protein [unclassified Colwellia]|uniref:adenylyltransferase/cytidyltransferase family protein n=1 Tax=unclassified Colwellia TaxID=196834 RepID=UPI002174EB41|nr:MULTISPECIES: adenylyltransferase/cytidyltransferase family protein [unclassified Colwellia]
MRVVLTYGTFDLFHVGHIRLLKLLSLLGNKFIVGVLSHEFNILKGVESFFSYEERVENLKSCKHVSKVFPEYN